MLAISNPAELGSGAIPWRNLLERVEMGERIEPIDVGEIADVHVGFFFGLMIDRTYRA
jgi:hypothetical protein